MQFRSDINAIRAYAVLFVVIFHFFPDSLPGGFAGVDIFFVVSGFLMTSIIATKLSTQRFSLLDFYHARVKRIVPALAVLCIFLLIYGWLFLLPTDYKTLAKHVASSQTFLSNFIFLRESGYFTADAREKWLLHTWSLSVEWQFYMLYPLLLLSVGKLFGRKVLPFFIAVLLLLSFTLSAFLSFQAPESSYFMIHTRAWEMLAGGLVFFLRSPASPTFKKSVSYLGFVFILAGLIVANESMPWPGYMAILPVAGTFLILWANASTFFVKGPILYHVGLASYSIYLWHWPVLVFISYMGFADDIVSLNIGVGISFVLGFVSYYLIERRFTDVLLGWSKYSIYILGLIIVGSSVVIYLNQGVTAKIRPVSMSDKSVFVQKYKDLHASLHDEYWLKCDAFKSMLDKGTTQIDESCFDGSSGRSGIFLWGDSHAEAFSYGLRQSIKEKLSFYQVTSAGCAPSLDAPKGMTGDFYTACLNSNKQALEKIAELKPSVVVATQANNHEKTDWNQIYSKLSSFGVKTLIVIGPLPQWYPSLPSVIVKRHWGSEDNSIVDPSLSRVVIRTNKALLEKTLNPNIKIANVFDKVCQTESEHYRCLVRLEAERQLMAVDYGHLSKEGSVYLTELVVYPLILDAMDYK